MTNFIPKKQSKEKNKEAFVQFRISNIAPSLLQF